MKTLITHYFCLLALGVLIALLYLKMVAGFAIADGLTSPELWEMALRYAFPLALCSAGVYCLCRHLYSPPNPHPRLAQALLSIYLFWPLWLLPLYILALWIQV